MRVAAVLSSARRSAVADLIEKASIVAEAAGAPASEIEAARWQARWLRAAAELSCGGGASRLAEVVGVPRSEIEVSRAKAAEWAKP